MQRSHSRICRAAEAGEMLRQRETANPAGKLRQGDRMRDAKTTLPGMPRGQRLRSGILNIEMHTSPRFARQHVREGQAVEMMIHQHGEVGKAGPQTRAKLSWVFPDG